MVVGILVCCGVWVECDVLMEGVCLVVN